MRECLEGCVYLGDDNMGERKDIIQELKGLKKIVSKKEGVEKIILFGSRASGRPKNTVA